MVTSNKLLLSFFVQGFPSLKSTDFLACFIIDKTPPNKTPSNKTPSTILEMKSFENDVINLIENIKFRNAENQFQISLANDLKKINSSPNIFVFADKTRNIYETPLDTYNKLMHDNITKTYKHGSEATISQINDKLKHISNNLGIGDQIEQMKKVKHLFPSKTIKKISKTIQNVD